MMKNLINQIREIIVEQKFIVNLVLTILLGGLIALIAVKTIMKVLYTSNDVSNILLNSIEHSGIVLNSDIIELTEFYSDDALSTLLYSFNSILNSAYIVLFLFQIGAIVSYSLLDEFVNFFLMFKNKYADEYFILNRKSKRYEQKLLSIILSIFGIFLFFSFFKNGFRIINLSDFISDSTIMFIVLIVIVFLGLLIIDRMIGFYSFLSERYVDKINTYKIILSRFFQSAVGFGLVIIMLLFAKSFFYGEFQNTELEVEKNISELNSKIEIRGTAIGINSETLEEVTTSFTEFQSSFTLQFSNKYYPIIEDFIDNFILIAIICLILIFLIRAYFPIMYVQQNKTFLVVSAVLLIGIIIELFYSNVMSKFIKIENQIVDITLTALLVLISGEIILSFLKISFEKKIKCPSCNFDNNHYSYYCSNCGKSLSMTNSYEHKYVGNVKTKRVHFSKCHFAVKISDNRIVAFKTMEDALNSGFKLGFCCRNDLRKVI